MMNELSPLLKSRLEKLSAGGDPLVKLSALIPWKRFKPLLKQVRPPKAHGSEAGRKPFSDILMFKILILQRLYHLSDHQIEFQIRDRMTFMRFLGLSLSDTVPDEKTIWLYREYLVKSGKLESLFNSFDHFLWSRGFGAKVGSIIDASIIEVPRQRNSKEENAEIKAGRIPGRLQENPRVLRQKDMDARWTQKHHQNYFGYKNHINIDAKYKLIRKFRITPACQADIKSFEILLDEKNPDKKIWADKAYRSDQVENLLKRKGYKSRIHYKPRKGLWISEEHKRWNHRFSKIRARVEHVFGFMQNSMKGLFIQSIGLSRAAVNIGLNNLTYNLCRYVQLRCSPCFV